MDKLTLQDTVYEMLAENPEWVSEKPERVEVLNELARLGIDPHEGAPERCPTCGTEDLEDGSGMVGERFVYCNRGCGILWEDRAGALAAVL